MTQLAFNAAGRSLEQRFCAMVRQNANNQIILDRLPELGLPDAWLVSGCLFQTVWNLIDGRAPTHGIRDYDLFYFDPDLSWAAEDAWIKRVSAAFSDLPIEIEARNQARVHLWYEAKFGLAGYPQLRSASEGIDYFLSPCCMVGVQPERGSELRLYAPRGLSDVFDRIVRPSRSWRSGSREERYEEKAKRWKALWPSLEVLAWDEPGSEA